MENSIEKFKIYVDDLVEKFHIRTQNEFKRNVYNDLQEKNNEDFISYTLNKKYAKAKIEFDDKSLLEIDDILKISDYDWQNNNNRVFNDYPYLSQVLEESHLKIKDKFNVLMWFILRDIRKISSVGILISEKDYFKLKPRDMSLEEFTKFLDANYVKELVKKPDATKEELKLVNKILDYLNKNCENSPIFTYERAIVRHCIDKDKITNGDIKIILQSLKGLKIQSSLIIAINNYLSKQIKEETIKEPVVSKSKVKSTYNYNELASLVNDFIDFTKMMPKRYLSLEERIYCLSILTKMNISKEERRLFLRNCELLSCDIDIITKYIEEYNRLKYYEEQVGLQKEIINMEEIFQELFICNKEDYVFWKCALEELMKQVECWIPKNFEYEEKEASRLIKGKEF